MCSDNSTPLVALAAIGAMIALVAGPADVTLRAADAGIIFIDDFAAPDDDPGILAVPGHPDWGDGSVGMPKYQQHLGTPFGQRDLWLKAYEGVGSSLQALIATGSYLERPALLRFASGGSPAELCIQYDGLDDESLYDYSNGLHDAQALGGVDLTDGGTNDAIALDFIYLDTGAMPHETMDLTIRVTGTSGSEAVYMGEISESLTAFQYLATFDEFDLVSGDEAPFTEVASITFHFNAPGPDVPDVDFDLTGISAVPEPSAPAMLFALAVGFAMIRRRRLSGGR